MPFKQHFFLQMTFSLQFIMFKSLSAPEKNSVLFALFFAFYRKRLKYKMNFFAFWWQFFSLFRKSATHGKNMTQKCCNFGKNLFYASHRLAFYQCVFQHRFRRISAHAFPHGRYFSALCKRAFDHRGKISEHPGGNQSGLCARKGN